MVPLVETTHLVLRSFQPSDVDPHAAMLADAEVVRHLGGHPFQREAAWRKLLAGAGMWLVAGFGYWAVERQSDRAFLGIIGFADFKRDLNPSLEGLPEMGWIFSAKAQGQGFALEAGRAALDWLDSEFQWPQVPAIIDPGNERSLRLADKLGFRREVEAVYGDGRVVVLRRHLPLPTAATAAAATSS